MFGYSTLIVTLLLLSNSDGHVKKPNFVVIFADDMGYGDLQSYGHPTQERGAIDVLAEEGMRFTQWYSSSSVCSPSRASLLTGRLPIRTGVYGPLRVFRHTLSTGLPKSETTIAEALKEQGYSTGMVGKWHLGMNEHTVNDGNHLPYHHGFDYVGTNLPLSFTWFCDPARYTIEEMAEYCYLLKNTSFIEQPINPGKLTRRIVDDALQFIREKRAHPFFLYMSMPQTHVAMFCAEQFCNKSKRGIYGDQINEMAWAVESVVKQLRFLQLDKDTLVLFVSDNGPHIEMCLHGGTEGILKGGKTTTWDGGIRVPAIAWWPGTIQAGTVSTEILSTMDIFPTLLKFAGSRSKGVLDGVPINHILLGDKCQHNRNPPHEILFFYCSDRLMAARLGRYKVHFFTQDLSLLSNAVTACQENDGVPQVPRAENVDCNKVIAHDPPLIFDMDSDPSERFPLDPAKHRCTLDHVNELTAQHNESIIHVPSLLTAAQMDKSLIPCCDPPNCTCNYSRTW